MKNRAYIEPKGRNVIAKSGPSYRREQLANSMKRRVLEVAPAENTYVNLGITKVGLKSGLSSR
jgi:hypothetical protein